MSHTNNRVIYIRGALEGREQPGHLPPQGRMSRGMIWVLLFLVSIAAWMGLIAAGWQFIKAVNLIGG